MQTPFDDSPIREIPLLQFLGNNLAVVLFLLLALGGMVGVYVYFSPPGESAEISAMAGEFSTNLMAPISKPVASRVVRQRLAQSPPPVNIAIIVGHRGSDSGAVCDDGLTEVEVNTGIATRVERILAEQGYPVTLFDEFDVRLTDYDGLVLLSIHADSCGDYGLGATGFKVAGSSRSDSSRLVGCVERAYQSRTGLGIHANTITSHMTDYHAFRKIAAETPAAILETGFMNLDRELLTTNADIPAQAIADGLICFLGGVETGG